jgi:putative ABC transport system permease protein
MDSLLTDVRQAFRSLGKARVFTLVAVLTLALGIGANAAVFAVVNGVVLQPFPWRDPEQLVRLYSNLPERQLEYFSVSVQDFEDWRSENRVFSGMAAFERQRNVVLRVGAGDPMEAQAARAGRELFGLLGVSPLMGRGFTEEEDGPVGERVALITHGLWTRVLGGDANVVGRTITLDGESYSVIGVLPASFVIPSHPADIWTPLGPLAALRQSDRGWRFLRVYARMRPEVTFDAAVDDMRRVTAQLSDAYPDTNRNWTISAARLSEQLVSPTFRSASWLLAAVALVVFLIAAGNVTNLLMTRAVSRRIESSTRMAMGASRRRVVREWVAEGILLGVLAGVVGLLVAAWAVDLVRSMNPGTVPRIEEIRINGVVVAFALGLSLVSAVLLMIVPALHTTAGDPSAIMREGGRGVFSARRARLTRGSLIIAQVAMTMLLLVGAGLLFRSFQRLRNVELGFDPANVMTARISLPETRYVQPDQVREFYDELIERVSALPGVRSAAAVSNGPFGGPNSANVIMIEGRPVEERSAAPDADYRAVTPGYFATMGIRLTQGRDFTSSDVPEVAIISEAMAREFWPDGNAIGSRFRLGDLANGPWRTIIGVAETVRYQSIETENVRSMVYLQHRGLPAMTLVVRTESDPSPLGTAIRSILEDLDPELAPGAMVTQQDLLDSVTNGDRFNLVVFAIFGIIALLLAAVGMYAVIGYAVTQRTPELGVRLALGARAGDLLRMVLAEGLALGGIGIALGLVSARAATSVMTSLLFQTAPTDTVAFLSVSALLLGMTLLASGIPAMRAMRVDPATALRQEA